jgi:hypothetical protein
MPKANSYTPVTTLDNDHLLYALKAAAGSDTNITWANLLGQINSSISPGLYNQEETQDISASFTPWTYDLDDLFAEADGTVVSWYWSGGNGTAQAGWTGGAGKQIGGISTATILSDLKGEGQGRLTLRKDGNNARILFFSDADGGQWSGESWEKTITGKMESSLFDSGTISAGSSSSKTFPIAYASAPVVNATITDRGAGTFGLGTGGTESVSTTGYTLYASSSNTTSTSYNTHAFGRWTTSYPVVG